MNPLICFLCCPRNAKNLSQPLSQRRQDAFLHSFWKFTFDSRMLLGRTSAFISRIFVEIGMLWLFHIFSSDAPIDCPRNSVVHSPSSAIRDPRYGNVSICSSCSFFSDCKIFARTVPCFLHNHETRLSVRQRRFEKLPSVKFCLILGWHKVTNDKIMKQVATELATKGRIAAAAGE